MSFVLVFLFGSSVGRAAVDCARRLEIPCVDARRLERAAGTEYMTACRELHAEVGPIFQYRYAPPWLSAAKPLLAAAARLPAWAGGAKARDFYASMQPLNGRAVHVASPEMFAVIAREGDAFGRFYGLTSMGLARTLGPTGSLRLDDHDPVWNGTHDLLAPELTRRRSREYAPMIARITGEALTRFAVDGELRLAEFAEFVAMAVSHEVLFGTPLDPALFARLAEVMPGVWSGRPAEGSEYTVFRLRLTEALDTLGATMRAESLAARLKREEHRFPPGWWTDQIVTLYFAGADTTRALMTRALIALAENPGWAENLRGPDAARAGEAFVQEVARVASVIGLLQRYARRDESRGSARGGAVGATARTRAHAREVVTIDAEFFMERIFIFVWTQ